VIEAGDLRDNRESLVAATRALDRVMLWNFNVRSNSHNGFSRLPLGRFTI